MAKDNETGEMILPSISLSHTHTHTQTCGAKCPLQHFPGMHRLTSARWQKHTPVAREAAADRVSSMPLLAGASSSSCSCSGRHTCTFSQRGAKAQLAQHRKHACVCTQHGVERRDAGSRLTSRKRGRLSRQSGLPTTNGQEGRRVRADRRGRSKKSERADRRGGSNGRREARAN